jgi:hypothetical protein
MRGLQNQPVPRALGLVPGAYRRVWAGLLVLALALASFMHVAHSHDADAPSTYQQHCGYCSNFDRGGTPPPASPALLTTDPVTSFVIAVPLAPVARAELHSDRQPRAPPSFQA